MTIDYRSKLWFGSEAEVPEGIFDRSEYPKVKYILENAGNTKPLLSVTDYYRMASRKVPRLLRGVPGVCPPENLKQGRFKYLQESSLLATMKGPRAVKKFNEFMRVDIFRKTPDEN